MERLEEKRLKVKVIPGHLRSCLKGRARITFDIPKIFTELMNNAQLTLGTCIISFFK